MCTNHKYSSIYNLVLWIIQNRNVTELNTVQTCRIVFLFLLEFGNVLSCLVMTAFLALKGLFTLRLQSWMVSLSLCQSYCTAAIWGPPLWSIASLEQSLQRCWSRRSGFFFLLFTPFFHFVIPQFEHLHIINSKRKILSKACCWAPWRTGGITNRT